MEVIRIFLNHYCQNIKRKKCNEKRTYNEIIDIDIINHNYEIND